MSLARIARRAGGATVRSTQSSGGRAGKALPAGRTDRPIRGSAASSTPRGDRGVGPESWAHSGNAPTPVDCLDRQAGSSSRRTARRSSRCPIAEHLPSPNLVEAWCSLRFDGHAATESPSMHRTVPLLRNPLTKGAESAEMCGLGGACTANWIMTEANPSRCSCARNWPAAPVAAIARRRGRGSACPRSTRRCPKPTLHLIDGSRLEDALRDEPAQCPPPPPPRPCSLRSRWRLRPAGGAVAGRELPDASPSFSEPARCSPT